jgi:hypothetical protein
VTRLANTAVESKLKRIMFEMISVWLR